MKVPLAVSAGLHVAVLLWATLSFSSERFNAPPTESLPVDFISDKQFSEITKGIKDAPKPVEKPKPVVEKKADVAKAVEDLKPKVTEKKEVKPTAEKVPQPPPPEAKPPKEKEKTADKPPEEKPDPIAKKIEQTAEKPKEQKEAKVTPAPLPPRRPPMRKPPKPKPPKFDVDKISALLNKREPERTAATGDIVNPNGALGRVNGQAAQLSQSVLDALRRKITSCWTPPVGAEQAEDLLVVFRVIFNPDGSVRRGPTVVQGPASSPYGPVFAESARRAILQCQPYTMLPRDTYNLWKDIEIGFKPSDMFQ